MSQRHTNRRYRYQHWLMYQPLCYHGRWAQSCCFVSLFRIIHKKYVVYKPINIWLSLAGNCLGFLLKNLEATSRVVSACIPTHHRELALPNEPNLEIVCVLSLPLVGSVDWSSWWSYRAWSYCHSQYLSPRVGLMSVHQPQMSASAGWAPELDRGSLLTKHIEYKRKEHLCIW